MRSRGFFRSVILPSTLLAIFGVGGCASASESIAPSQESIAVQAILENGTYIFPEQQQCLDGNSTSISDFLTDTVLLLREQNAGSTELETNCQKVDNDEGLKTFYSAEFFPRSAKSSVEATSAKDKLTQCTLSFTFSGGEAVWSRGVQVLVNTSQKEAIPETFRCLMTP